jgi:hypothetical protein
VLVNLMDPTTAGPRQVTVDLGAKFRKAELIRMSGPALDARDGITLAGKTVASDGTFPAIKPTRTPVSGATLKLSLPPGSATLVTLTSS